MEMRAMKQFITLNIDTLENIEGGDRKGYCSALVAGRILRKTLLNQRISSADYKCN